MTAPTLFLVLCGVGLNAIAQLLLKGATVRTGPLHLTHETLMPTTVRVLLEPLIWGGLLCYVLSVGVWIVALSRTEISLAYPFLSLGYVVAAIAAWQLFDEALTVERMAAIGLICIGVALLYRSGS